MTTYYFIRHAEKVHFGRNPELTKTGHHRAKYWAQKLKDETIQMIYCTPLKRTLQTAYPLKRKLNIEIKTYDPADLYNKNFREETKGKTVLVVGHQDTTPLFVNRILQKRTYGYIQNFTFGNLYKVTIDNKGNAKSSMHHLNLP